MAAEAAVAASTAVVAEAVFMEVVAVASTVAEATEAAGTTARPAAAAMAAVGIAAHTAVAGITIRCLLAAHIPRDVLATRTAQPVTEDMRRGTVATTALQAVVQA
jgi:hypothetical protein